MTLEVGLIALYRVVGSLPTLRWPLAGGQLAIFVDLTDLYWMNVLDLGGIPRLPAVRQTRRPVRQPHVP